MMPPAFPFLSASRLWSLIPSYIAAQAVHSHIGEQCPATIHKFRSKERSKNFEDSQTPRACW